MFERLMEDNIALGFSAVIVAIFAGKLIDFAKWAVDYRREKNNPVAPIEHNVKLEADAELKAALRGIEHATTETCKAIKAMALNQATQGQTLDDVKGLAVNIREDQLRGRKEGA